MFVSSLESFVWCQNLETSQKKSKTYQHLDMLGEKEGRREKEGHEGEAGRRGQEGGSNRIRRRKRKKMASIFICSC